MNTPGGNRYGWGVGRVPMPRDMRKSSADELANQGFFASFLKIAFQDFPWIRGLVVFCVCVSVLALVAVSSGKIREPDPPRPVDIATIILQKPEAKKPKPPEKKISPIKKETHTPVPKPKETRKHPTSKPKAAVVVVEKTDRTEGPVMARRQYTSKKMSDPAPETRSEDIRLPNQPEMAASSVNSRQRYYALNSPGRETTPPGIASDSGPIRFNAVSEAPVSGPALFKGRYSNGNKETRDVPISETNEPIFSGNSGSAGDHPGFGIGTHAYSPNQSGGNRRPVAADAGSGGNPLPGTPQGDLSGLVSLDDLGVCIDPKEEFALRSELAARLDKPGRCQSRELSFVFRYVETGYTIHLDVYNPKKLRLGDRCAVLRKAAECVENQ